MLYFRQTPAGRETDTPTDDLKGLPAAQQYKIRFPDCAEFSKCVRVSDPRPRPGKLYQRSGILSVCGLTEKILRTDLQQCAPLFQNVDRLEIREKFLRLQPL